MKEIYSFSIGAIALEKLIDFVREHPDDYYDFVVDCTDAKIFISTAEEVGFIRKFYE